MFDWNKDIRYRNIHGFHVIINMKNNEFFEISPLLAKLFDNKEKEKFVTKYEKWIDENKLSKHNNTKVKEFLDDLVNKGILIYEKN
jgi:hypothetical protein